MISVYVFGVIIVVLFVAGLVVAPLLEDEPADPDSPGRVSADRRREAALEALEELEFEHETGKLSDGDYRRLRNKYAREAVAARDAAEAGRGEGAGPPGEGRAGAGGSRAEQAGAASADGPARCPECGAGAGDGARFCLRCGAELPA